VKRTSDDFSKDKSLVLLLVCVCGFAGGASLIYGQARQDPGRSIGNITTQGDLIVMELNEGAFGKANMFDLPRRTLRFIPDGAG